MVVHDDDDNNNDDDDNNDDNDEGRSKFDVVHDSDKNEWMSLLQEELEILVENGFACLLLKEK